LPLGQERGGVHKGGFHAEHLGRIIRTKIGPVTDWAILPPFLIVKVRKTIQLCPAH
jgi:hypothetical protein